MQVVYDQHKNISLWIDLTMNSQVSIKRIRIEDYNNALNNFYKIKLESFFKY